MRPALTFSAIVNSIAPWDLGPVHINSFQTKTLLFCSAVILLSSTLQRRKRSPKTEPFENAHQSGAIWKRCFLKTLFSSVDGKNDAIWKRWRHQIDTTGRQTTQPWVSKMADRGYHVASISRQFRGPIYWNAHVSSSFKSFCLRDRGSLGNEGRPILLKIGTQSRYVDLCNMPRF